MAQAGQQYILAAALESARNQYAAAHAGVTLTDAQIIAALATLLLNNL